MKLIVGLGNPTSQYEHTRHNVGFEVIDRLVDRYNIPLDTLKNKGMYGKGNIEGQSVILLKPMTFMNLSGECIRSVSDFYKIPPENIVIILTNLKIV